MTMDPDGLWPRRADAAKDGLDEDRDVDDLAVTLDDDLPMDPDADAWTVDADDRSVDFDEADDRDADLDEDDYLR